MINRLNEEIFQKYLKNMFAILDDEKDIKPYLNIVETTKKDMRKALEKINEIENKENKENVFSLFALNLALLTKNTQMFNHLFNTDIKLNKNLLEKIDFKGLWSGDSYSVLELFQNITLEQNNIVLLNYLLNNYSKKELSFNEYGVLLNVQLNFDKSFVEKMQNENLIDFNNIQKDSILNIIGKEGSLKKLDVFKEFYKMGYNYDYDKLDEKFQKELDYIDKQYNNLYENKENLGELLKSVSKILITHLGDNLIQDTEDMLIQMDKTKSLIEEYKSCIINGEIKAERLKNINSLENNLDRI